MKRIVNINGKTKEEVLISKLEIENRDLKRKITELNQALQLQQTGVIRSAFAVIPDAEKLGIGNNKITAVFKHKHQAEAWARSMWKNVYIIEQVRSEHFL